MNNDPIDEILVHRTRNHHLIINSTFVENTHFQLRTIHRQVTSHIDIRAIDLGMRRVTISLVTDVDVQNLRIPSLIDLNLPPTI